MIQSNISLKPFNTFGIDVTAKKFAVFKSVNELKTLFQNQETKSLPLLILGGGSNILLTKDYAGLVLKNELHGIEIVNSEHKSVFVKSAAGENWHDLVMFAIKNNLGGIENLSLIPGSVGAAPMQNIGAYGVEVKDIFHELEAYEIATGKIKLFNNEQCKFGYRESVFKQELKNKFVITSVTFKLIRMDHHVAKNPTLNTSYGAINDELLKRGISNPTIKDVSDAVISIRQSKLPDPKEIGNSGSFFKNPVISKSKFLELKEKFPTIVNYPVDENHVKLAAGWLIENAGWKGKTVTKNHGNQEIKVYGVHKNQALVLVNYGGANGNDIYNLSEDILKSVKTLYGVDLEREVNIF